MSDSTAPGERESAVTSDVLDGEIFLKNEHETVRLSWTGADLERERTVPTGRYRLLGYRIVDGDWMLSSTGGRAQVKVHAGRVLHVAPSSTVHLDLRARRQHGQVSLQLGITNGERMGLSVYRGGKRIPLGFTLLDAAGAELAGGSLEYG